MKLKNLKNLNIKMSETMVKMEKTKDVIYALKNRYDDNGWSYAFLEQVSDGTGKDCNRWADALAVQLWTSRGLEIIGFEIKVSRQDWIKELKQPQKADAVAKYCHQWYLVVGDADIVRFGELPTTWGLMVPHTKKSLKVVKPAVVNKNPKPIDMSFLCAILRRATQQLTDRAIKQAEYSRGYDEGKKDEKENNKDNTEWITEDRNKIRTRINQFEKASGIDIDDWRLGDDSPRKIGEIVKSVMNGTYMKQVKDFQWLQKRAEDIVDTIKKEIEKINEEQSSLLKNKFNEG